MSTLEQTVATLVAAREWLIKNDWTQGAYFRSAISNPYRGLGAVKTYNKACSACSVGAIGVVCQVSDGFTWHPCSLEAIKALALEIAPLLSKGLSGDGIVIDWNDTPGRTKEEVIDLFDRTITRLNAQRSDVA